MSDADHGIARWALSRLQEVQESRFECAIRHVSTGTDGYVPLYGSSNKQRRSGACVNQYEEIQLCFTISCSSCGYNGARYCQTSCKPERNWAFPQTRQAFTACGSRSSVPEERPVGSDCIFFPWRLESQGFLPVCPVAWLEPRFGAPPQKMMRTSDGAIVDQP